MPKGVIMEKKHNRDIFKEDNKDFDDFPDQINDEVGDKVEQAQEEPDIGEKNENESKLDDNQTSDQNTSKSNKKDKKKWFIILGASIAAIIIVITCVIIPMTTPPKPVVRDEVPAPEESAELVEEIVPVETAEPTPEPSEAPKEILPELLSLYEQNEYLAGWLEIPDTVIDYPVMYTPEDGEYYLYRTFENEEDPTREGCLFIDEHCTIDPRSTNLLIHGHNMKNGTMFHSLLEYADEEYYKEHPVIYYSSLWDEGEYEIVSVFRSRIYNQDDDVFKYYKFYNAANEEEFNNFIDNIKELELYDTGVTAQYGDELITLATCEYTVDNGRFVVVARKKA